MPCCHFSDWLFAHCTNTLCFRLLLLWLHGRLDWDSKTHTTMVHLETTHHLDNGHTESFYLFLVKRSCHSWEETMKVINDSLFPREQHKLLRKRHCMNVYTRNMLFINATKTGLFCSSVIVSVPLMILFCIGLLGDLIYGIVSTL